MLSIYSQFSSLHTDAFLNGHQKPAVFSPLPVTVFTFIWIISKSLSVHIISFIRMFIINSIHHGYLGRCPGHIFGIQISLYCKGYISKAPLSAFSYSSLQKQKKTSYENADDDIFYLLWWFRDKKRLSPFG